MGDPACIAAIRNHPGKLVGDAQPALGLSEQHHPAVGGDPSAIEGSGHLLARYRWQVEGERDILAHNSLWILNRCATSARESCRIFTFRATSGGPPRSTRRWNEAAGFHHRREQLVALASRHAVPAIYEWRE